MSFKAKLKPNLLVYFLTFTCIINAQTQYEKGYFIDNNQNKVECLIENVDWKNNPEDITYKFSETSEQKVADLSSISKFEIYDIAIYTREEVDLDINSTTANKLDYSEKLDLKKQTVFLKLLVGGKANLYVYQDANLKRFYYQIDDGEIAILIQKEYITSSNKVAENQNYKGQLYYDLKCNSLDMSTIRSTDYVQSDLMALFEAYNSCKNQSLYTFKEKTRKNPFHLKIRPGINFAYVKYDALGDNFVILTDFEFNQEMSFRLGIELEYILPFNNDKWAILFEPTYQYYNTEKTFDISPDSPVARIKTATVEYSSIEFPIGFRHYSHLNDNSRLFFNVSFLFDRPFKSNINYFDEDYEINSVSNLAFGAGYSYKNTYSIEARLFSTREILNTDVTNAGYKNVSVIFGYTIL
jgi:hypothetical protein